MKTHSGSKKRFRKNAAGKVKCAKANHRHHSWSKNGNKNRNLRRGIYLSTADEARISRLIVNQ